MLAASAPDVDAAWEQVGDTRQGVVVDGKLDGIRLQAHRDGDEVRLFTRSLDDITDRLPEVVEAVLALPVETVVIDGEAIALDASGRPRPFQETASRTMSSTGVDELRARVPVTPYFFDLLHVDGQDLLELPASERFARLAELVLRALLVPRITAARPQRPESSSTDWSARVTKASWSRPLRPLCRRASRSRLGQGQATAHARPRGAGRRVGQRTTPGVAVQHPPRRA